MRKLMIASAVAVAWSLGSSAALAKDAKGSHAGHQMKAVEGNKEAVAVGVINSVDVDAGKINVTHEPVPALGWPTMTMDLPVTRRVDLSTVKPGAKVNITLKQGRDKQFRVMAIEPKK
ncbi:MAG: copper-binding protein [Hyphomicrobiaceae bacterium]